MSKTKKFTLEKYFQDIKTPEELNDIGDVVITKDEQMVMIGIVDEVLQELREENMLLREMLWLRHGCTSLYGDDGEMQCGNCVIDFKRMSAKDIQKKWHDRALISYMNTPELQQKLKELFEKK